jgi:hypothetical protein
MIITRGLGSDSLLITRGFGVAIFVERIISVLPQFITRRVSFTNIARRIVTSKIARREDD